MLGCARKPKKPLYLAKMGRHAEAFAEARQTQRLEPLSIPMNPTSGLVLCFARQYDRSIEELQRVIEMDANFAAAHSTLGLAYAYRKMCDPAIAEFRKASALAGQSSELNLHLKALTAYSYAASGRTKEARTFLNEIANQPAASQYALGMIHAQPGERNLALDWLERAYRERNYQMVWMKVDPALDPLRRTRRFQILLTRVGLALRRIRSCLGVCSRHVRTSPKLPNEGLAARGDQELLMLASCR